MTTGLQLIALLLAASVATLTTAEPLPRDVVKMLADFQKPAAKSLFGKPDGHELWHAKAWSEFKQQFQRSYTSDKEERQRQLVFLDNLEVIRRHNQLADRGVHSYRMGVNAFTDMTHQEFLATRLGLKRHARELRRGGASYISPATQQSLPDTVDWRKQGAVTPVKDQGQCGSCWSFSTTGALEGQHFRKTHRLLSLSEQQLVDCSGRYGNQGCNGGLMDRAFAYVKANGIELESDYKYRAVQGTCKYNKAKVVANCTGFVDIPQGNEAKLKEAVANVGPVSVAIDASHPSFQHYRSGVYNEPSCSSSQLDHGVLVVGYGTLSGSDYWLVKNSWSPLWGEQGYIRMTRNGGNQCGIASSASYPTV